MASRSYQLICDNVPNAVVLTDFGPRVIEVVKVLRRRAGLSLWQGRSLLDRLPATVLEDVSQEMAEAMVRELVEVGAKAEVRQPAQLLDTLVAERAGDAALHGPNLITSTTQGRAHVRVLRAGFLRRVGP
ncbi:ribosomal protein L7/L12 [Kitasatospora purpeofusca]|uniref:ribosomal protein L7/L12 n=1 Tax=Kitasatospora purpeofusca TaxID=67352 RepID=UPI0035D83B83